MSIIKQPFLFSLFFSVLVALSVGMDANDISPTLCPEIGKINDTPTLKPKRNINLDYSDALDYGIYYGRPYYYAPYHYYYPYRHPHPVTEYAPLVAPYRRYYGW